MEKLNLPETAAHHSIALTGGFFGIYALLLRSENFGSSETANLIYLFAAGLGGDWQKFGIRLAALFVYVAGLVFATLIAKRFEKGDIRYPAILVDLAACLVLAQIPADGSGAGAVSDVFCHGGSVAGLYQRFRIQQRHGFFHQQYQAVRDRADGIFLQP